ESQPPVVPYLIGIELRSPSEQRATLWTERVTQFVSALTDVNPVYETRLRQKPRSVIVISPKVVQVQAGALHIRQISGPRLVRAVQPPRRADNSLKRSRPRPRESQVSIDPADPVVRAVELPIREDRANPRFPKDIALYPRNPKISFLAEFRI